MSNFIKLLRQYHQAIDTQYSSQLSPDMRKAIFTMLSCKTRQQLSSYLSTLGFEMMMFERFKPGFLMTMLAILEAQKAQLSGEGFDIFYSKRATQDNKKIEYFETADFQLSEVYQS